MIRFVLTEATCIIEFMDWWFIEKNRVAVEASTNFAYELLQSRMKSQRNMTNASPPKQKTGDVVTKKEILDKFKAVHNALSDLESLLSRLTS